MRRVTKPWGYEIIWAETDRYVGKILHIAAGQKLSRQYHLKKDETFLVEAGEMDLEIGQGAELARPPHEGARLVPLHAATRCTAWSP